MHLEANNLDDLLIDLYEVLLNSNNRETSTKGSYSEITGCTLKLSNPLARLSRSETKGTLFSCLGELLWYLSGSDDADFISYYIKNYKQYAETDNKIHGGYGPRLHKMRGEFDQIQQVIHKLKEKPTTRQAVIQLFDASDIATQYKDTPCTLSLQFLIRNNQLDMYTMMRSNDAFVGLPHDIFVFTMLQEIIARRVGVAMGSYTHFVTSMHLYLADFEKAVQFKEEGFMPWEPVMQPMPSELFEESISLVLALEKKLRTENSWDENSVAQLAPYWQDLIHLLKIYNILRRKIPRADRISQISAVAQLISNKHYIKFVKKYLAALRRTK